MHDTQATHTHAPIKLECHHAPPLEKKTEAVLDLCNKHVCANMRMYVNGRQSMLPTEIHHQPPATWNLTTTLNTTRGRH